MKLLAELRGFKKGLINIKNNDQKCFLWCHVRHIYIVKIHPEIVTREDKKLANDLNCDRVGFPARKKDFGKFFVMKISCFFQFTFHIKSLITRWIYYS